MADATRPRRRSMVGWYDPRVLAHSAYQLAIANVFGRHSDTRLIEALANQPQTEFDYSAAEGDFWLDYAADIGDGWNSTYEIADAIATPELQVEHGGQDTLIVCDLLAEHAAARSGQACPASSSVTVALVAGVLDAPDPFGHRGQLLEGHAGQGGVGEQLGHPGARWFGLAV